MVISTSFKVARYFKLKRKTWKGKSRNCPVKSYKLASSQSNLSTKYILCIYIYESTLSNFLILSTS